MVLLDLDPAVLTDGDGVDLAFDLQGALVTLEGINHLFELRVTDHQTLGPLLVFLQPRNNQNQNLTELRETLTRTEPTTHHSPLLSFQLQNWWQRAGLGGGGNGSGGGGKRFGSATYWSPLTPQTWVLVGLLVIADVFQTWRNKLLISRRTQQFRQVTCK